MSSRTRTIWTICVLSTTAGGLHAQDLPEVRVAYHPNLHGAAVVSIGETKGFFQDAGIAIQATRFTSGPPEIAAIVAGQIDIGFIGTGALPPVLQGKAKIVAIDLIGLAEEILARPGSGIARVEDLAGKRVLTTLGTSGEMILRLALSKAGLGIDDLTVETASPETAVASFTTGQADAIALWQPLTNQVRKIVPDAVLVASGRELYPEHVFPIVWIANSDFVEKRPDLVRRFLMAARRAIDYRAENLDEAIKIVAEYAEVPIDILEAQRNSARFLKSAELDTVLSDGTAKRWFAAAETLFKGMGRLEEAAPPEQYLALGLFVEAPEEAEVPAAEKREESSNTMMTALVAAAALVLVFAVGLTLRHLRR